MEVIKTHTSMSGEQVECTARVRECPRGGDDEHMYFESVDDSKRYNELALAEEFAAQTGIFSSGEERELTVLKATSDKLRAKERMSELSQEIGEVRAYYPVSHSGEVDWVEQYDPLTSEKSIQAIYLYPKEMEEYRRSLGQGDELKASELRSKSDQRRSTVDEYLERRHEVRVANGEIEERREIRPLSDLLELMSRWDGSSDEVFNPYTASYEDASEVYSELTDLWEYED